MGSGVPPFGGCSVDQEPTLRILIVHLHETVVQTPNVEPQRLGRAVSIIRIRKQSAFSFRFSHSHPPQY